MAIETLLLIVLALVVVECLLAVAVGKALKRLDDVPKPTPGVASVLRDRWRDWRERRAERRGEAPIDWTNRGFPWDPRGRDLRQRGPR